MTDPVRTIADRVRTRVLRDGVDLARDDSAAARYAHEGVRRYSERALSGAHAQLGDELAATREVVASITGSAAAEPDLCGVAAATSGLGEDPDVASNAR
ncbi:hypothetical protein BJY17_001212 [Agromyces hippuratus]|uniref:Uncharacterized protein n=1 Tax=Agromyces hippuratus TaxID=286438 RepID=A0A852X339_9MICO|nr:hypothetical protein [Agromyces hippuratus]NYG20465.1 hypothetical protein [Agromyces hippuratus]